MSDSLKNFDLRVADPKFVSVGSIAIVAETLNDLARHVYACRDLGLRDVTVTTVPVRGSNVKLRYHLEARLP